MMLITLIRTDAHGRNRLVTITDRQLFLFSEHAFTVVSETGRERVYSFDRRSDLDAALRKAITDRTRRGYRVLYSYFRANEYPGLRPVLKKAAVS